MSTPARPGDRPTGAVRLVRLGRSAEYGAQAAALVAALVLAPAVVLLCGTAAGGSLPWWTVLATPLVLLLAPRSGTVLPGLLTLLLLALWVLTVPGPFSWWALPAAAALLLLHLAAAALASTPSTLRRPAAAVRRWGRRTAVVLAVTAAVAGAADLVRHLRVPGSVALGALALLLVAAWPWLARRPDRG